MTIRCFLAGWIYLACLLGPEVDAESPYLRDFIGLNGHYKFKPDLYEPICGLARNYHNMSWDVAKPGDRITFPVCVNKVNWEHLYSKWNEAGFEVNVCLSFGPFGRANENYKDRWKGQMDWAEKYGYEVAHGLRGTLLTRMALS